MYSFDGQHKTGLKVSLGGASKKVDKSTLLQAAREKRLKRETGRQQQTSAVKIQAWYRGGVTRKALAAEKRAEYDKSLKASQSDPTDSIKLQHLCQRIVTFYKFELDYQRLVSLCQILLKTVSSKQLHAVIKDNVNDWIHRIKNLLLLCCRSLTISADANITIPLRMLEVFTEARTYSWLDEKQSIATSTSVTVFIVQRGYFSFLRELVNKRVPSSIEPTDGPPTPFASALKDMVLRPFKTIRHKEQVEISRCLHLKLIEDILSPPMNEQLCYFLVPSIASKISLQALINSLITSQEQHTLWTLYSLLIISRNQLDKLSLDELHALVACLKLLVKNFVLKKDLHGVGKNTNISDSSDDSDMETDSTETRQSPSSPCENYAKEQCLERLNDKEMTSLLASCYTEQNLSRISDITGYTQDICDISYHLFEKLRLHVHKSRFLYKFAFNKNFLRSCWQSLLSLNTQVGMGREVQIMNQLSYGYRLSPVDESNIISMLTTFSVLFKYALFSIYDADFYGKASDSSSMMPFKLPEIVDMSRLLREVVLGLILLIYPDKKTVTSYSAFENNKWTNLCQSVTQLLKQIYSRDTRHPFCPENHWLSARAAIGHERSLNLTSYLEDEADDDNTGILNPGMSTINKRSLAILKYVPFAVPFLRRVRIFQRILSLDRSRSLNPEQAVLPSHGLNLTVNRKYLYQDAYDQLAQERCPDIRKPIRVHMINAQGLDEAGVDGGGVFREFMSQLLKLGFDPSYGFFKPTSQQLLYPNPDVRQIQPDYIKHTHFLGRMLGKAIYESMMVELPLADFFLCKLLNKYGSDVDIYHLESLDPEMYQNLLSLKNYEGDVEDLDLNFTVVHNDYGETRVEDLKPGGGDIAVTNSNKIEYIHLMADYRLNKQIRSHCNAFRAGLTDVIDIEWLQLFDHRELQILISGAPVPIDINDLRLNTNYSGKYSADDAYMQAFWEIVEQLTDKQKRQFLKFVTSCSRPPLLGFSDLLPKFCIHYGGAEDRLPTASTCMNFLKLPEYESTDLLRTRLIYAIEAEAGFELS